MSERYALVGRVLTRTWGAGAVVYHEPSGSTHEMQAAGAAILAAMHGGPLSLPDLRERLAGFASAHGDEAIGEADLASYLRQFVKLGLVESVEA